MARRRVEVLTARGRSFVASGVTLVAGGTAFGFPDLTRAGLLLVGLPLVTALATRRHQLRVSVSRTTAPVKVAVDEPAAVTVEAHNAGASATPILLCEEHVDYVLGDRPRFIVGAIPPGSSRTVRYSIRSHLRGRHHLGPLRVQLGDPFGLSVRYADVGIPTDIVIRPRVEELLERPLRGVGTGAEGEVPFMVALHGEDDVSIREYRDGDDLRRVHWRATARTGELMVRQEDRPARRRAVVVLDPRVTAHSPAGSGSSFEWAVSAAASIVVHLERVGCVTHLVSAETVRSGLVTEDLPADDLVDALAVEALGTAEDLGEVVRAAHWAISAGGYLITVVGDGDSTGLTALAGLRRPGAPALALVVRSQTFGGDGRAQGQVAEMFRRAGWSTREIERGVSVASAWSGDQLHQVGAR